MAPAGAPVGVPSSTHLPLNNGCSRVVNHFAPTCAAAKKHVNIEREKLAAGGGTAAPNHYHDDIDTEEEEQQNGKNYSTYSQKRWVKAPCEFASSICNFVHLIRILANYRSLYL